MENTCNYSDEWQPYIGDYDKYEYDIRLKDGTIVENCYPNAGKFNSISDEHNQMQFAEDDVSFIRFSEQPRFGLNQGVSRHPQHEWLDARRKDVEKEEEVFSIDAGYRFKTDSDLPLPSKKDWHREVKPVRNSKTDPKIQRNEPCPCGSGLKYKKCCQLKSNHHGSK
jgi:hypothetical protein